MSFILDALKKSETERQQQTGAGFSSVPSRPEDGPSLKWLWILAVLLAVNVAVLLYILLRPADVDPAPAESPPPAARPAADEPAAQAAAPTFAEQIAEAREAHNEREAAPVPAPQDAEPAPAAAATPPAAQPPARTGRILTIDELRLSGVLQIPDLHLDLHVYDPDPGRRFVFVNMEKYRENGQLAEGPVVEEITPDGVILRHQGTTFMLPRE